MRSPIVRVTVLALISFSGCAGAQTPPPTPRDEKIESLLMTAQRGTAGDQIGALDALAGYPDRAAWTRPFIRMLLDAPSADVDRAAARVLWAMGEEAVPQWLDAAKSRDGYTRRLALGALADERLPLRHANTAEVLAILEPSLHHASPLIRQPAAEVLCRLGPRSAPMLTEAIKSGDDVVRGVVLEKVMVLNGLNLQGVDDKVLVDLGREMLPGLLHRYQSDDVALRRRAFFTMTGFPVEVLGEQAVPILVDAMSDGAADIRREAFLILIRLPPEKLGDKRVDILLKATTDPAPDISMRAVDLLVAMGKSPVLALIVGVRAHNVAVRSACVGRLVASPDTASNPEAVAAMAAAIADSCDPIREQAIAWARSLSGEPAGIMARSLAEQLKVNSATYSKNPRDRITAIELLSQYATLPDVSVPALQAAMEDPGPRLQLAAIVALRVFGAEAKPAFAQLVELQRSSDERIAGESAETLFTLGPEGRKATAPYYIAHERTVTDARERLKTINLLEQLGPDAAAAEPGLRELLADEDNTLRVAVARALGAIGPEARASIPALTHMVDNRRADLRQAAVEALVRIAPDGKGLTSAMMAAIYNGDRFRAARLASAVRQSGDLPAILRRLGDLAENDPDHNVRGAARDVVQVLSNSAVPASTTVPARE